MFLVPSPIAHIGGCPICSSFRCPTPLWAPQLSRWNIRMRDVWSHAGGASRVAGIGRGRSSLTAGPPPEGGPLWIPRCSSAASFVDAAHRSSAARSERGDGGRRCCGSTGVPIVGPWALSRRPAPPWRRQQESPPSSPAPAAVRARDPAVLVHCSARARPPAFDDDGSSAQAISAAGKRRLADDPFAATAIIRNEGRTSRRRRSRTSLVGHAGIAEIAVGIEHQPADGRRRSLRRDLVGTRRRSRPGRAA